MMRSAKCSLRRSITVAAVIGPLLACADGPTGMKDDPSSLTIEVVQGEPYVAIAPVRFDGIQAACDLELRVVSGLPDDLRWTRAGVRTRARIGAVDSVRSTALDSMRFAFLRRAAVLPPLGRDAVLLTLAAGRPFDWELELTYRITGRRGEASRLLSGRCGPTVPASAPAPVVELVEIAGGGPSARVGDTVEVAFLIRAEAGLYRFSDGGPSIAFVSPADQWDLRIFGNGPRLVERRRRLVLGPELTATGWDYSVSAFDLLDQSASATFRIAGSGSPSGVGPPTGVPFRGATPSAPTP